MKSTQRGISLIGLILVLFILVVLALFAMKIIPSYIEYSNAKSAIEAIARENPSSSPAEVRRAFEMRSAIDNVAIKPADLEITKEGNQMVIGFAYRKEVPLMQNVGLYIDYAASSRD